MSGFANLPMVQKLAVGFGSLLVALVVVGGVGVRGAIRASGELDVLYQRDMASVVDIRRAQAESIRIGRCARHALLEPEDKTIATETSHVEKSDALVRELFQRIESRLESPEDRALIAEARDAHTTYFASTREMLARAKEPAAGLAILRSTKPLVARLEAAVTKLDDSKSRAAKETFEASAADSKRLVAIEAVVVALAILFGIAASVLIGRSIAHPLARATAVLRSVAQGDFRQRLALDSDDETGRMAAAVDDAAASMSRALAEVRAIATALAGASRQLAGASEAISGGAQQQAASLEEASASLDEISSTSRSGAENAEQMATLAVASRDLAEKGGRVVQSAVAAMAEVMVSSNKIADVVATIEQFAFQTNMLAINAAVEAARVGEQGRGFSVVASEVRNLALSSAGAAKEIKGLISDAVAKIRIGSQQVGLSGETLHEIVSSAQEVTARVGGMAGASREQTERLGEITGAVQSVDRVTQSNAAQTEELAATAGSLAAQADQLSRLVATFKLGDEGSSNVSTAPSRAEPASPASGRRIPIRQPRAATRGRLEATAKRPRLPTSTASSTPKEDTFR